MSKKLTIAGAVILIIIGLVAVSIPLAQSGAVSRTVDKYNLLNMIDGSKNVMAGMNTEMDSIKGNIGQLNDKLDVLAKVVSLLDQQVTVVAELNQNMGQQQPLLSTANGKLDDVQSGINYTLSGVMGMKPTLEGLLASMGGAVNTTAAVADGMAQLASVGSIMCGQLDDTLRYLTAMQPQAAKAHRAMGMIPIDLASLLSFLPTPSIPVITSTPQATADPAPADGGVPVVGPVVNGVTQGVGGLLQGLTGLLFGR